MFAVVVVVVDDVDSEITADTVVAVLPLSVTVGVGVALGLGEEAIAVEGVLCVLTTPWSTAAMEGVWEGVGPWLVDFD